MLSFRLLELSPPNNDNGTLEKKLLLNEGNNDSRLYSGNNI